jgi:fumarate hydratase, class I
MALSLEQVFYDFIKKVSTELPADIRKALQAGAAAEDKKGVAGSVLLQLVENADLAAKKGMPICQDTGTPNFFIDYGPDYREKEIVEAVLGALRRCTADGVLRPNAVHSLSGKNSGDNTGALFPTIHCHQQEEKGLRARLLLKGGGSENVSAQYSLPDSRLSAGRDLKGVAACVLDAVFAAQGQGCAPAILGVGIGGDRNVSYLCAKEQLLRDLGDRNPDKDLAALEEDLLKRCNELGIGPMGFGGKTTVLGVKIGHCHRLPASFFVSIAYLCWAARKGSMSFDGREVRHA